MCFSPPGLKRLDNCILRPPTTLVPRHTTSKKGSDNGIQNIFVVSQFIPIRISFPGRLHANQRAASAHFYSVFLDRAGSVDSRLFIAAGERQQRRHFGILREERLDMHHVPQLEYQRAHHHADRSHDCNLGLNQFLHPLSQRHHRRQWRTRCSRFSGNVCGRIRHPGSEWRDYAYRAQQHS